VSEIGDIGSASPQLLVPEVPTGARLALRQIAAMIGLEIKKTFLRGRALPLVLVALLPVILLTLRAASFALSLDTHHEGAAGVATVYSQIFQLFHLRLVVFFVCFGIFTYLVRGEIAERSLHFYLLTPLRREVYLLGKYVSGFLAAGLLFTASVVAQLLLAFLTPATDQGAQYLFEGPGAAQAVAYVGTTLLGVAGYGAVFLTLALYVRNPMIPAAVILGWEWINFLLPPALKKISVIHYLQSLCPLPLANGPFALPAEPTPAPFAIGGLLALIAVLLTLAMRRARRLEVSYGTE
jgi:hypothetical protein